MGNKKEITEKYKKIAEEDFIILDTSTTDLYSEVIDIAIIDNHKNILFNQLIKPRFETEIAEDVFDVHNISMSMLKDKKELSFYIEELTDIFSKYKNIFIYNAEFDIYCLQHSLKSNNIDKSFKDAFNCHDSNIVCAMLDYAYYYNDFNDYFLDYTYQKLSTAARRFKFDDYDDYDEILINSRKSLRDCIMTLHVIDSIAKQTYIESNVESFLDRIKNLKKNDNCQNI